MGYDLQDEFIEQEELEPVLLAYRWFCYCNNAPILKFYRFNLTLTNENEKALYAPFLDVWSEMRKGTKK